jgi:GAF domain-containing protein
MNSPIFEAAEAPRIGVAGEACGAARGAGYTIDADDEAAERRGVILQTIGRVAEYLLNAAEWEHKVEHSLAELGKTLGVSRTYIFEIQPAERGEVLASQRYEWATDGVEPQIGNEALQEIPLRAAGFARWVDRLGAGDTIHGHIRDFPESERTILGEQDIRSLLAVPIFAGAYWWGFMGFDECREERE